MNKVNDAGYNESTKFGPSENNPPKLNFEKEYIFDNKEVDVSLPGCKLSDIENLTYFFEKYKISVERGKPNQRIANQLKTYIDIIQVNALKINT